MNDELITNVLTLLIWKFSETSVSWMSISRRVDAVGVPDALPHEGEPRVDPGEDVVRPSNTFRNFFMFADVLDL